MGIISSSISMTTVYDGVDGKNAVRIDLDNEADMIACDANGKVRFNRSIATNVRLYDGATAQTISQPTVVVRNAAGQTVNMPPVITPTNGVAVSVWTLTWNFTAGNTVASTSYDITVSVIYNSVTYSAKMTITRTDAEAIYQLYPSTTEVVFGLDANNEWTPLKEVITCGYQKITGSGVENYPGTQYKNTATSTNNGSPVAGMTYDAPYNIYYRYNGEGTWQWLRNANAVVDNVTTYARIEIGRDTEYHSIEFVLSSYQGVSGVSDANIIDRETVPIVKSGKKGPQGNAGDNAIHLDLDNEHEDFIYKDDTSVNGGRVSSVVTSTARLYNGSALIDASTVAWSISASSGVVTGNSSSPYYATVSSSGVLTVNGINATTAYVTVCARYPASGNKYYYATFSANKTNQDKYELVVTPNAVPFNPSSFNVNGQLLTFTAKRTDLTGSTSDVTVSQTGTSAGTLRVYRKWVSRSNGNIDPGDLCSNTYTVTKANCETYSSIILELRKYGANNTFTVVDYETVPFNMAVDGQSITGDPGHVGRFYYFAGDWNSSGSYTYGDSQAPYVMASDGNFYMLDYAANNYEYTSSMPPSRDPVLYHAGNPWTLMDSTQQYYIAKAFFGNYAQFGSFIINEDWMISKYGVVNGQITTDNSYTHFDPRFLPGGSGETIGVWNSSVTTSQSRKSDKFDLAANVSYTIKVNLTAKTGTNTLTVKLYDSNDSVITSGTRSATGAGTITLTVNSSTSLRSQCYITAVIATSGTATIGSITISSTTNFVPNYAVDGKTGKVYMNNAFVSGDITARGLVAGNDSYTTEISPGITTWRSVANPLEGISIGIGTNGMYIRMTNSEGNVIWQIDNNGYREPSNAFGTIYLKKVSSASPAVNEFSNVTQEDCTLYYTQSNVAYREPSTSSTKIQSGYYVGINNGSFKQNVNTGAYTVLIYQYGSDGAYVGKTYHEFYM